MISKRVLPLGILSALLCIASIELFGCSADRDVSELLVPQDVGVLVIDAMLVVGQPLPSIRVTRTVAPDQFYDPREAGVPIGVGEGTGYVRVLGGNDESSEYRYAGGGRYVPSNPGRLVRPDETYRLHVKTDEDEEVFAMTTTPSQFDIEDWVLLDNSGTIVDRELFKFTDTPPGGCSSDSCVYVANSLPYSEGLLEARFDRPFVEAFQVGLFSLDADSGLVVDLDFLDEEDIEDFERTSSSPPLLGDDGTLRLPWFAIYYSGRYLIRIHAMDDNWYDLVRTSPDLAEGGPGFGGNAGDNFERPIFHIDGGIGLFGSMSFDEIGITVLPRP